MHMYMAAWRHYSFINSSYNFSLLGDSGRIIFSIELQYTYGGLQSESQWVFVSLRRIDGTYLLGDSFYQTYS